MAFDLLYPLLPLFGKILLSNLQFLSSSHKKEISSSPSKIQWYKQEFPVLVPGRYKGVKT